jgi:hypothetical protein
MFRRTVVVLTCSNGSASVRRGGRDQADQKCVFHGADRSPCQRYKSSTQSRRPLFLPSAHFLDVVPVVWPHFSDD